MAMDLEQLKKENAELKAANAELESQAKLMRTIYDSLNEGVVATNVKREYWIANPTGMEIVGMGATNSTPDEWSEIYGTFYPDKKTSIRPTNFRFT